MANSLDLVFTFEDLTHKSKVAKKIVAYFKRGGLEVIQVDDPQKLKRTSGISYKELNIVLANGESIMLRVKQSGDIYQVLINGKVMPIKNQDDQKSALNEIIARSKNESSAFQKRISKQAAKEVDSGKAQKQRRTTITTKLKISQLTEKREALKSDIEEAEKVLNELRGGVLDSTSMMNELDLKAHKAATSPFNDLQQPSKKAKEDNNYYTGDFNLLGIDICIENPEGSVRSGGVGGWHNVMQAHYGFISGVNGADGDELDVFVKPMTDSGFSGQIYIINQVDQGGVFDEHKIVIGASSEQDARDIYLSCYKDGWDGLGSIDTVSILKFKSMINEKYFSNAI